MVGSVSDVELMGYGLGLVAQYPINEKWTPFARIGRLWYEGESVETQMLSSLTSDALDSRTREFSDSANSNGVQVSAGIAYQFNSATKLKFEYQSSDMKVLSFADVPDLTTYKVGFESHF